MMMVMMMMIIIVMIIIILITLFNEETLYSRRLRNLSFSHRLRNKLKL